jgi:hypothetical protein
MPITLVALISPQLWIWYRTKWKRLGWRIGEWRNLTNIACCLIKFHHRSPVVIFLSDGECGVSDDTVYRLCRMATSLGYVQRLHIIVLIIKTCYRKPLAFHAISFGQEYSSGVLKRMATIAKEVYEEAPAEASPHAGPTPCSYHSALDTVSRVLWSLGCTNVPI